jgi:lysophospholipase L1-like esterase
MHAEKQRRTAGERWKSFAQSALLLVASLVVAFLIGELIVYARYRERIVIFPRYVTDVRYGDYRIRRNVPNARYRHKSVDGTWHFTINGNGFRDTTDYAYEKPEGVLRILVLGDSFTIGYEVEQDETYSAVLERYLERHGVRAEVLNAGMSGASTAEALVFLEHEGVRYEPDIVVLGFYWNDLEDNLKADLFRMEGDALVVHKRVYTPAIRTRKLLNSFWLYRFLSERSYLHNYLNMIATRHFKQALLRENVESIRDYAVDEEAYAEELGRALVSRIREVAHEHGAEFILLDIASKDLEPSFPWRGEADLSKVADHYLDTAPLLREYEGIVDLRMPHGHGHWTPFAHVMAGTALGASIVERLGAAGAPATASGRTDAG